MISNASVEVFSASLGLVWSLNFREQDRDEAFDRLADAQQWFRTAEALVGSCSAAVRERDRYVAAAEEYRVRPDAWSKSGARKARNRFVSFLGDAIGRDLPLDTIQPRELRVG